jgi:hypothetical protein
LAALEPDHVVAGGELGVDRADGLAIVGVDVIHERPGQQLLSRVPEDAPERWVGQLEVPVEPRDAERIKRKIEEPYQLVVERLARLNHNCLV